MNPPSAWAVAKRDAPQIAEQCWTHGFPVGSEGPLCALSALLLEYLELFKEQGSGEEPAHASVAADIDRKLVEASGGYDLPAYEKLTKLKVWAEAGTAEGHALPLSGSL